MNNRITLSLAALATCLVGPASVAEISLESAPPVVVKTVPVAGATDVDPALAEIKVTFSKAMQDGSWSWSTWGEENFPEMIGTPRYLPDGRTCVITVKLKPDKFYATWLNSEKFKNFKDTGGRSSIPYLLTFTTGAAGSAGAESVADGTELAREGWQLWQARKLDEAAAKFRSAVKVAPDNSGAWNGLGWACFNSGKNSEGEKAFQKAVELEPGHPAALNGLGQLYLAQNKLDKAEEYLLKAAPQAPAAWFGLSRLYLLQGKFDQAETWARKIVDSGEANDFARQMLQAAQKKKLDDVLRKQIAPANSGDLTLLERAVDKAVAEFPKAEDLSTPEGAVVAWQRASAAKDASAISKLSLVPLDPKEQKDWYQREETRDPDGLAVYLKALAESKVIVVQTYRGELANVVTFLPFPEGKGRNPYSTRSFGLVDGAWKNLGEDRWPDLDSAKKGFEGKKERLWQRFVELKKVTFTTGPRDEAVAETEWLLKLNDDQRAILAWTDRQFRSFFDARTFDGWSAEERGNLEKRLIDALSGPRSRDYYQGINSLAALRSTNALPKLREIAFDRAEKDNRDRWMAIRALGIIGDKTAVPELAHLVYHGNTNTRWWAQISLVRLTGQNFGKDWNAWGKWWNEQNGQPPFKPEIIRWWSGQASPDELAASLDESDQKFLAGLKRPTQ